MRKSLFVPLCALLTPAFFVSPASHGESAPPSRWESAIAAFEKADREKPAPEGAILFIGSSSIRGWRSLAADFPDREVVNRGFGGSVIADSIQFAGRIVLPRKPAVIVFYAGENDLTAGLSPAEVADDFKRFVELVHAELPETIIAFISMKPSPRRAHLIEAKRVGNALISDYAEATPRVDYLDVFHPMLDPDGNPRPELFVGDQLHLNAEGYRLWAEIVGPYLDAIPQTPRSADLKTSPSPRQPRPRSPQPGRRSGNRDDT